MRIRLAHEYSLILAFALQDKKTYLSNIIYIDNVSSKKKKPPRYLEILNYDTLPTSYPSALHLNTIRTLHHNALHLRKNPLPKTPLPIPPHKKIPPHPPHPHSRNHNPDHRPPPPQHPPHHPRRHNRHRNGTSPTHYPLLHLLPPSSSPSLPTPHLLSHPHPSKNPNPQPNAFSLEPGHKIPPLPPLPTPDLPPTPPRALPLAQNQHRARRVGNRLLGRGLRAELFGGGAGRGVRGGALRVGGCGYSACFGDCVSGFFY